jgi:hypothetical protein
MERDSSDHLVLEERLAWTLPTVAANVGRRRIALLQHETKTLLTNWLDDI